MHRRSFPLFLMLFVLSAAMVVAQTSASVEVGEDGTVAIKDSAIKIAAGMGVEQKLVPAVSSSLPVPVIVVLNSQPLHQVANSVKAQYLPEIREKTLAVRGILARYAGPRNFKSDAELREQARREAAAVSPADRERVKQLSSDADALLDEMRKEISRRMRAAVAGEQAQVAAWIRSLGGSVTYGYSIENSVAAMVPGTALMALAKHPLVSHILADELMEAQMNVSGPSIFVNTFWNALQDGGTYDGAIMDTGVDTNHPGLNDDTVGARTWYSQVFHATAKNASNYDDISTSTDDLQGHGTHVAGTVFSSDPTYRGIAFGGDVGMNLKVGYLGTDGKGWAYDSDVRAALDWSWSQAGEPEVVNYSFGGDTTDEDDASCQYFDSYIEEKMVTATISAGNSGSGAMTVTSPGIAYNAITVANISDMGTTNRTGDTIASSSSRGPTQGGRDKPDISAPGSSIMSANNDWETESDYVNKSGTSMASPHIAGATLLLNDVGVVDPREVKAVLINTADDWGDPGWDAAYGWGYVNLDRAYLHRADSFLHSVTERNTTGEYKLYKTTGMDSGEAATLVWYRHAVYNGTSNPTTVYNLNDLNLRLYDETNNTTIATDLDNVNNVHQVVSNRSGTQVIRVYAWSASFSHGGNTETYALATQEGTTLAADPTVTPSASNYTPPLYAEFTASVRVQNTGDVAAHNCSVTLSLPSGVFLAEGSATQSLGTIGAGSSAYAYYNLDTSSSGVKTVSISTSSSSYGLTFNGSGSFTVTPGAQDTVDPYTTMRVGGPTYQMGGTDKIANGGFESDLAGWATSGTAVIETGSAHDGAKNLKLGSGSGSAYQTATVNGTASRAFLTFWYKSSAGFLASAGCSIQDTSGNTLVYPFYTNYSNSFWTKVTVDVSRFISQTVRLNFYSVGGIFGNSTLWVDDVSLKENETVWVDDTSQLSLSARDDNSGIDYSQYHVGGDPWATYSTAFDLAGKPESYNYVYYRSVDNSANDEPTVSALLWLDTAAPKSVLRIDSPRYITGGTEKVSNGGFESNLTGWTTSGIVSAASSPTRTGIRSAKIGGTGAGYIYQDVAISAGAGRAFVSAWVKSVEGAGSSYIKLAVVDPATGLSSYSVGFNYTSSDWFEYVWDVTAFKGSTVRLWFEVVLTSGGAATVYVDDVRLRQDGDAYVLPSTDLRIYSAERSGVQKYEHKIDAGSYTEGQYFTLSTPGFHTVRYRALDNLDHQESDVVTGINVDSTGPTGSIAINAGAVYTTSTAVTLNISASDVSGVTLMRIKNSGGAYTAWESYAVTRAWTLPSGDGTKTVVIQFQDSLGNVSSEYSDDIRYLAPTAVSSIGEAKAMTPYPVAVVLNAKAVTGIFYNWLSLYIEEEDRSSGIKVNTEVTGIGVVDAERASFEGVLLLNSDKEPELYLTDFASGIVGTPLNPLGMNNLALGGGAFGSDIPGITSGMGLHNVGLLVRTWGEVVWRDIDGYRMRINDGSGVSGGGILVDNTLFGPAPALGKYVGATGNLGTVIDSGNTVPIIRVRKISDIDVY